MTNKKKSIVHAIINNIKKNEIANEKLIKIAEENEKKNKKIITFLDDLFNIGNE